MSALPNPSAAFLALCAHHGVDPNSIPNAERVGGGIIAAARPRQRPRSPDRKASRDRRRRLGGSSALPDTLRHHYTEGQRAVLCIVAGEVKRHGVCDLPIDKIAALAGVGRTTVQTTMHIAWKALGHIKITRRPRRGQKSLTNLVEVKSPEWLTWLKRGPSAHKPDRVQNSNLANPTKNITIDDGAEPQSSPSVRAVHLAAELAKIAGHDPKQLPRLWERQQPALIVESWLRHYQDVGMPVTMASLQILKFAQHVMKRKPERCPPNSIKYFGRIIEKNFNELRQVMRRLPGVVRDFRPIAGTGGGRTARDLIELEIYADD
jgi:hypothetical protein